MAMKRAVVYEVFGKYEYEDTLIWSVLEYDDDVITIGMVEEYAQDRYGKMARIECNVPVDCLVVKKVPKVVVSN